MNENNKHTVSDAIGRIDPEYIEDAANITKTTRLRLTKVLPIAACLVLIVAGGLTLPLLVNNEDEESGYFDDVHVPDGFSWNGYFNSEKETGVFEDRLVTQLEDEAYAAYVSARVIDEEYVSEKISEGIAKAYWSNGIIDSQIYYLAAEIYCINEIDPQVAVCVKYLDSCEYTTTAHYYTYVNSNYVVEDIEQLYEAYAFDKYFSLNQENKTYIGNCRLLKSTADGVVSDRYDFDNEKLIEFSNMITSLSGEIVDVSDVSVYDGCSVMANVYFSLDSAGVSVAIIRITDNGYITFALGDTTSYTFNITSETAVDILSYIVENAKQYQTSDSNTEIVTVTAVSE